MIIRICLDIFVVTLLICLGGLVGWTSSKFRRPWWLLGYILPLIILLTIGFARRFPALDFVAPFRWVTLGRLEFALLGPIVTCLFGSLWNRLPHRRLKKLLTLFIALVVLSQSLFPFAVPLFMIRTLNQLPGEIIDGICLQSTGYTCGPAAAVSALYQLDIQAAEGEIALQAYTSTAGTSPDLLCRALNKMYAAQGVTCTYRPFSSLQQLKDAGLTIVLIKFSFLIDHYVTVLEITDDEVVTADPAVGLRVLTHDQFLNLWRRSGLTLQKN